MVHEDENLSYWVEDGLHRVVYKTRKLDGPTANACIDFRLQHSDGSHYPMLIDARNIKEVNKEARECFAGEKASRYVTAAAFLIDSVLGKLTGNFFLTISKPKVPTRLFTSEEEAMNWLSAYRNQPPQP